jgi:hypothetical protein
MARPGRFELPTLCLEGRCSIQLSYGRSTRFYHRLRCPRPSSFVPTAETYMPEGVALPDVFCSTQNV